MTDPSTRETLDSMPEEPSSALDEGRGPPQHEVSPAEHKAMPDSGRVVPTPLGSERTMEQIIARQLRELILEGALAPGERLRYRDLARQFQVSVTPVRIALRELTKEGLVDSKAHEGARVSPLSAEALEELYATRIGIETWLVRYGAPQLTRQDLDTMAACLARAAVAFGDGDREELLAAAWTARRQCFLAADRPHLVEIADALYQRSARYHRLTVNIPQRLEETHRFLQRFVDACLTRDGKAAASVLTETLERAVEYMLDDQTQNVQYRPAV